MRTEAVGWLQAHALDLCLLEPGSDGANDGFGDPILQIEYIYEFTFEAIRPEMHASSRIYQLSRQPQAAAGLAHAALKDISHADSEVLLLRVITQVFEWQDSYGRLVRQGQGHGVHIPASPRPAACRRSDVSITTARQGFDPTLGTFFNAQGSTQRGNLNREIAFFNQQARPRGVDQRVLGDDVAAVLYEHAQQGHG